MYTIVQSSTFVDQYVMLFWSLQPSILYEQILMKKFLYNLGVSLFELNVVDFPILLSPIQSDSPTVVTSLLLISMRIYTNFDFWKFLGYW